MREFGHSRPIRNERGDIEGAKPSPVTAVTHNGLSGLFGPDRDRQLIVSLEQGDLIVLRPKGRRNGVIKISAFDVYRMGIQMEANRAHLEKARASKEKKAERLARARLASAERRMTARAKAEMNGGAR